MKKYLLAIVIVVITLNLSAQTLSPLKVEGRYVKTLDDQQIQIKAVNINDYMEHSYNRWGETILNQSFSTVLSWLHTADDYVRIKAMGFNAVRLNICPSHFDSIPNLQRIKDHIQWARQNNLYIIIGYFAPRGSVPLNGYYDESAFWVTANTSYRDQFKNDWKRLMDTCKARGYRNVLYNILNEPQINFDSAYGRKINLYDTLLLELLAYKNFKSDSNLVVIDGPAYAQPDLRGYNYLNSVLGSTYNNQIIYDFHYYMFDLVWRRSLWTTSFYPYHDRNDYRQPYSAGIGYDTITLKMNLNDNLIDSVRIIKLMSLHQCGKYILKYFEIKNELDSNIILSLDMTGKVIQGTDSNKYILNNGKTWKVNYGGPYWTASQSSIFMTAGNSAMVFSNTVKQDTSTLDIDWRSAYSEIRYDRLWPPDPTPIHIPINTPLAIKLVMDGDTLNDNGSFQLNFLKDSTGPYTNVNQKLIKNFRYVNYTTNEKDTMLTSHTDRVNAVFRTVKDMSVRFAKPFLLGEFAIPIQQRVSQNFSYFRDIYNNLKSPNDSSIGWCYHAYREPHENWRYNSDNWITVSLFSGRNMTNATVNNIINGTQNGQTSFVLESGDSNKYYINKLLIDTLTRLMGGTFTYIEPINNIEPVKYSLEQNYPNPFNPKTNIRFGIPATLNKEKQITTIIVYDVLGREITVLVNDYLQPGNYEVFFEGSNFATGIYFYTLKSGNFIESKKMILIK
ncbi:MAG TPA: cellulase family glycosylhydrolase [Ignavibacteria bacterium]